jgi:hypothetical protein
MGLISAFAALVVIGLYIAYFHKSAGEVAVENDIKSHAKKDSLVVADSMDSVAGNVTFSEYYQIDICPKCRHRLDHDKARYDNKCCYLCGHRTGILFDTQRVVVRDRYVNGNLEGIYLK